MWTFNITEICFDKDVPWSGIFDASAFSIHATTNRFKSYSLMQLLFVRGMIIPIQHKVDWELIWRQKGEQIKKDNICKNLRINDNKYKVGDKVMLNNNAAYKYKGAHF